MKQQPKIHFDPGPYPGRGLLIGQSVGGDLVTAYFLTGRSKKSRARRLTEEPDGISIEVLDREILSDTLRVYRPVIKAGPSLIVSNGVQTDLIAEALTAGDEYGAFRKVMGEIDYEPDSPHFTPRISGLLLPDGSHIIGIVSRFERECYEYPPLPGIGHIIYTYAGDGDPLPSYRGAPRALPVPGSTEELADILWESLDSDKRVSLYVRYKSITSESESEIIYNKY